MLLTYYTMHGQTESDNFNLQMSAVPIASIELLMVCYTVHSKTH